MKKIISIISLALITYCISNCNSNTSTNSIETQLTHDIISINDNFHNQIDLLIENIVRNQKQDIYQPEFDSIRRSFKEMEWAIAFFMPETYRFMNGPNLDEIEFEESAVIDAEGLQTIEEFIYPEYRNENKDELIRYLKKLKTKSDNISAYFSNNSITVPQTLEAIRYQIFRIITLGITGFDTPISGKGLYEVSYSLTGINRILEIVKEQTKAQEDITIIQSTIKNIQIKLAKKHNRDSFNYVGLITDDLNKLSAQFTTFMNNEGISRININSAVNANSKTLFDKNAWNSDFFAPSQKYYSTPAKEKLGEKLFTDKILSESGTRSCQSCHNPKLAFSDGLKTSISLKGTPLKRNSPSLTYSNFQHGQFWDMRREDLESQSMDVITNKDEMHGSLEQIIQRLTTNQHYKKEFQNIFKTDTIKNWHVQNALASYIRSLSTFSSEFDRYMQGNKTALNKDQIDGFNLFVGKGKCATCHFMPLFNGTVPPDYVKTESEVLGTAVDGNNKILSSDLGRGHIYTTISHTQRSFKTPSLRNSSKTAPYMHNGGYKTLEEVMKFYNEGGGNGLGFNIDNQTLPADKLNLTEVEIKKIIAFLHALTDKEYL